MNHHVQVLCNQTRLHEITRRAAMVTLLGVDGGSFRAGPPSAVPHVPGIHVIPRTGLRASVLDLSRLPPSIGSERLGLRLIDTRAEHPEQQTCPRLSLQTGQRLGERSPPGGNQTLSAVELNLRRIFYDGFNGH